jgi:hypothetical protein
MLCCAGLATGLVGCGSGGGGASSPTETTISPLAALMGWVPESPEESQRKQLQVEEMTATCMREEGWEYTPVDWSSQGPQMSDDDLALMNDPEAYGKKYGYGVAYNYELYDLPNIDSGDGAPSATMAGDFQDPNQPYVDSLTDAERDEYYASLSGDPSIWEGSEDEDFVQPTPDQMGCQGKSQDAVYGGNPARDDADVQARLNDYWTNSETDPRLLDAYARWRECMGPQLDDMFVLDDPVETPNDVYNILDMRKYVAMGLEAVPYDPDDDDGTVPYVMAMSDASGKGVAYTGEQHAMSDADLEQLRTDELALWKTDHDCQREAKIDETRQKMEQELVDQLTAEFPELSAPAG